MKWSVFKVQNFSPLVTVIFASIKWSLILRGHGHPLLSLNGLFVFSSWPVLKSYWMALYMALFSGFVLYKWKGIYVIFFSWVWLLPDCHTISFTLRGSESLTFLGGWYKRNLWSGFIHQQYYFCDLQGFTKGSHDWNPFGNHCLLVD